jgi:competence protein ComEC
MWLIILGTATVAGILLGDLRPLDARSLALAIVLSGTAAALVWRRPRLRLLTLATCAFAAGGLRAALVATDHARADASVAPYYGHTLTVYAQLVEPPALTATAKSARLILDPRAVALSAPALPARIVALADPSLLDVAPGNVLTLRGKLVAPSDARAAPTLLFATLEAAPERGPPSLQTLAAGLRQHAQHAIAAHMPEPEASLAAGIVLGGASGAGLDPELRLALRRSGLAHIVAIDGYKQVLLVAVVGTFAIRVVGAYWSRVPVLLCVASYTLLTGAHPSAVRSGIMVALASLAMLSGRTSDALTSLVVASTLMSVVDPGILLDVGMQLSVTATLGIILLWPALRRRLHGVPRWLAEPAGLTVAVTVATLPIELAVFQSVSLVSPIAHIAATPLLPIVFATTTLVAITAPLPLVPTLLAPLASIPTTLLVAVIRLTGSLPGAALTTPQLSPAAAIALGATLLTAGLAPLPELRPLREAMAKRLLGEPRPLL